MPPNEPSALPRLGHAHRDDQVMDASWGAASAASADAHEQDELLIGVSRYERVRPPDDHDLAGAWRMIALSVGVALGIGAVLEGRSDHTLSRFQKAVSSGIGSVYVAGGLYEIIDPRWLPRMVREHPQRVLAAAVLPLAGVLCSGGRRSPLHTLAAASGGGSAIIYGRQTGTRYAAALAGIWLIRCVIRRPGAELGERPFVWWGLTMPLVYINDARIAATLASLAYNARSVDAILTAMASERAGYVELARRLDRELAGARPAILTALLEGRPDSVRRDRALKALGRVNEQRAALRAVRHRDAPSGLRAAVRRAAGILRHPSRLHAVTRDDLDAAVDRFSGAPQLPLARRALAAICEEQVRIYRRLEGERVDIRVEVPPHIEIVGVDRIALLAATVAGASSNAVRHAPNLREVVITATVADEQVVLAVFNDGVDSTRPLERGHGINTLNRQAKQLGATLEAWREGESFWLSLKLAPDSQQRMTLLSWEQTDGKFDQMLREFADVCAAMVYLGLAAPSVKPRWRTLLSAAPSAIIPVAVLIERRRSGRPGHWPMLAAAVASALNADPHRGVLSGYASAVLARHAVFDRPLVTLRLCFLNATGMGLSYLHDYRAIHAGQLFTLVGLPGAMLVALLPLKRALLRRDREIIGALSGAEIVNDLVIDLAGSHSSPDAIEELAYEGHVSPQLRERLLQSVTGIDNVVNELGSPYRRALRTVVGDVRDTVGRRVWPSPVSWSYDLTGLSDEDVLSNGLHRVPVRRQAIAAADLAVREALSHHRVDLSGDRPLSDVHVHVAGEKGELRLTVWPVARHSPADVQRLEDRAAAERLTIVSWTDEGRLTFAIVGS